MKDRSQGGATRIWALTTVAAIVTAGLALVVVGLPAPQPPLRIPPTLFGILFYLGEATVLHVRFRRHAHSFSMSELPLILSLYFLAPVQIIVLQLIGTALALAINRRQRSVKLAFNLTQISLQTVLVIGLFSLVTSGADPLGPIGWLAVALGIIAMVVVSNTLIRSAILLSGGVLEASDRNRMYAWSTLASSMNGALALMMATVLWAKPLNAWLALIPAIVLFFAYRSYLDQRQERDQLEALYDVSGELHRHPRIDHAMKAAVEKTRQMFAAEIADIYLFPDGLQGQMLRTTAHADAPTEVMVRERPNPAVIAFASDGATSMLEPSDDGTRGVAMHVAIGSEATDGVFVIRSPLSDIGSFGSTDLRLFETMAEHVGVSLRNGRLEDSLARVTELKDELHRQALRDGLTGLANRRALQERLEEVLDDPRNRAAVVFVDLDDFKQVNDSHGHEAGDAVLVEVARRLQRSCRPHDTVSRLGGDEFAVLLEHLTASQDAVTVADRIIQALSTPVAEGPPPILTTASVGIAMVGPLDEPDDVLRRADTAMYAAKADGKGRYRLHADDPMSNGSHALASTSALRSAIDRGELRLHYQPIRRLDTEEIVAIEALVRWEHPARGLLRPDQFIPLAERRGLITDLGAWVLDEAMHTIASWHAEFGDSAPPISVNLSSPELTRPGFVDLIIQKLTDHRIDPTLLQVEITEAAMATGGAEVVSELRRHGVRVALDDFGAGYSTLAHLDRLPVDVIKLDPTFTERIAHPRARALVELLVTFGERLGYETIAEAIETTTQLEALRAVGCPLGQGYHLGRPLPEVAARALITADRATPEKDLADIVPLRQPADRPTGTEI